MVRNELNHTLQIIGRMQWLPEIICLFDIDDIQFCN